MMMEYPNYKVGDRIVCLKAIQWQPKDNTIDVCDDDKHPVKGIFYTVQDITFKDYHYYVQVIGSRFCYHASAFEKVRHLDYDFVDSVLTKIKPTYLTSLRYAFEFIINKIRK